jgi:hypothetical protein
MNFEVPLPSKSTSRSLCSSVWILTQCPWVLAASATLSWSDPTPCSTAMPRQDF